MFARIRDAPGPLEVETQQQLQHSSAPTWAGKQDHNLGSETKSGYERSSEVKSKKATEYAGLSPTEIAYTQYSGRPAGPCICGPICKGPADSALEGELGSCNWC